MVCRVLFFQEEETQDLKKQTVQNEPPILSNVIPPADTISQKERAERETGRKLS